DEDEPDQYWYYFQANGKAYKGSDSGATTRFKTINGKKYAFDEDGKMLYGWVKDGERNTGDDDWEDAEYYLGDENDGAMKTGWQLINLTDENWPDDNETFDEDQDRWFYFKSNGKRYYNDKPDAKEFVTKTINGKKYGFDENGRMVAEWNVSTTVGTQGEASYTREWSYFASPEDGARKTKGWFKVIPDEDLDEDKYDDAEEHWYYADGKGKLYANEIKTINGRKYAFDEYGRMMDGLRLIQFDGMSTKLIADSWEDDEDPLYYFDTEDNLDATIENLMALGMDDGASSYAFMYFGDEDDGAMKTGKQTITIDGDKIDFEFNKNGSQKGQGRNEVDEPDKVVYAMGKKYKADSDNKYEIVVEVAVNGTVELSDGSKETINGKYLRALSVQEYLNSFEGYNVGVDNKETDADKSYYVGGSSKRVVPKNVVISDEDADLKLTIKDTYVVNTSGSLVKKKNKCKDGDDYIIEVSGFEIQSIYEDLD
ncbi:cell wall-binding protein, partial [Lachnospiraceae bacterium 62-35]